MKPTPEERKVFQKLGKISHKKSPRSKEFYQKMQKGSVKKRKGNKLSTPKVLHTVSKGVLSEDINNL